MSLEIALAENTAAIRELIAHLKDGTSLKQPTPEEIDANIKDLNKAPKPQAAGKGTTAATQEKPAPTQPTAGEAEGAAPEKTAGAQSPSAEPAEAQQQASTAADDAPDYATTAKAVTDLVKAKGRDVGVGVLAKFGAANLKEVKPEQFAEVIEACKEAAK